MMFGADEETGVPGLALSETNMIRENYRKKLNNWSSHMPLLNTKDSERCHVQMKKNFDL